MTIKGKSQNLLSVPDQKEIKFHAITPGLGFHPFSDGLPYAPVSKTVPKPTTSAPTRDFSQGAGATAAGPATFVAPTPARAPLPAPRVSVPVATPTRVAPTVNAAKKTAPTPAAAPEFHNPTYGFVYLLKRVCAYLLDTVLNLALLATGLSFALWNQNVQPDVFMNPGLLILGGLFCLTFNWALVTAQEVAFGTSIGKRIFGLALRGSTAALFLRAFFFLPSLAFCGIGLAWSVFDRQRRCWHDLVVNVQPIEIARL